MHAIDKRLRLVIKYKNSRPVVEILLSPTHPDRNHVFRVDWRQEET